MKNLSYDYNYSYLSTTSIHLLIKVEEPARGSSSTVTTLIMITNASATRGSWIASTSSGATNTRAGPGLQLRGEGLGGIINLLSSRSPPTIKVVASAPGLPP